MTQAALPGIAERASAVLDQISRGNWHQARTEFSDSLDNALDEEGLARAWTQVVAQVGEYRGMGEPVVEQAGALTHATVPLDFAACEMLGRVSFDARGRIAGLHFLFGDSGDHRRIGAAADLILRCSDGHFYAASRQTLLWRTIHFGSKQLRPCPVDQKWRIAEFVDPGELTRDELAQAAANRV